MATPLAMIDCVVGDVGEIGLFTHPNHRRRGLATATSAAIAGGAVGVGVSIGSHPGDGTVGGAERLDSAFR